MLRSSGDCCVDGGVGVTVRAGALCHSHVCVCSRAKCQILLSVGCAFQAGLKICTFQKILSNSLEIIAKGSRNPG